MSGKWKRLIWPAAVAALLPANLWLARFYWKTRILAEKKILSQADGAYEYATLDTGFAIAVHKKDRKNNFICTQEDGLVNITFEAGRIRTIAGLSPKDIFHWGISGQCHYLLVGQYDLYDFNRDFVFDYLQTPQNKFIQVRGEWLPAKEVKLSPVATALLKDGRTFVWQKSVWAEKK